jgi:Uma2 family endonuclease
MVETYAPNALSDYEIERGKPMPDKNHAIIQGRLIFRLNFNYGEKFSILPEIHIGLPTRERVPDLAIYPPLSFEADNNEIRMTQMPLCAIEILSEMQNLNDLSKKCGEYFTAGIPSYWLVLPALTSIYVFHSRHDYKIFSYKDRLIDSVLDIELDLGEIFR